MWLWHGISAGNKTFWFILLIFAELETRLLNASFFGVRCNCRRYVTVIIQLIPVLTLCYDCESAQNNC